MVSKMVAIYVVINLFFYYIKIIHLACMNLNGLCDFKG